MDNPNYESFLHNSTFARGWRLFYKMLSTLDVFSILCFKKDILWQS